MKFGGSWIWAAEDSLPNTTFVNLRKTFVYEGGRAKLFITADHKYNLYVNKTFVGTGPVRAWTAHYYYDVHDISPYLKRGNNVIAVLANHHETGSFQHFYAPCGVLAQLELERIKIVTDGSWKGRIDPCFEPNAPQNSLQLFGREEQFDARLSDDWKSKEYDDSHWQFAAELRPADDTIHTDLKERDIPFLTNEQVYPSSVVKKERVKSIDYIFTIDTTNLLSDEDRTMDPKQVHAYLATNIDCPKEGAKLRIRHKIHFTSDNIKLNNEKIKSDELILKKGFNTLVIDISRMEHRLEFTICCDSKEHLRFSADTKSKEAFCLVGPFGLPKEEEPMHSQQRVIRVESKGEGCSYADGLAFWNSCDIASVKDKPCFQVLNETTSFKENVFAKSYTDKVIDEAVTILSEENLLANIGYATFFPDKQGRDIRVLLDFSKEIVATLAFSCLAKEGTVIDFHMFEFIQPDGRYNYNSGVCSSFRYICKEGLNVHRSFYKKGFRYCYVTFRNLKEEIQFGKIKAFFECYPQQNKGAFLCSDWKLNKIWEAGAHTIKCCSDDTYVDCPTFEQVNWVGDARNEALVDYTVNGDPRLWYRCLEQTGQSLDRSDIVESNVPSSWFNILPAWTFFWMRSIVEYYVHTKDVKGTKKLFEYLKRNAQGVKKYINKDGLFEIRAWNMFDWAAMDTPAVGVVTHQNCFLVQAFQETAYLAGELGEEKLKKEWTDLAQSVAKSINEYMWNEEKKAYTDCLRGAEMSKVYSQQTQTAAFISGVALGERKTLCKKTVFDPPEDFVKSGSPFFEFFLLETMQEDGDTEAFLKTVRRDWGFMVDMGATTFWEQWSNVSPDGRLTRSHCHGWSSAPTYFLCSYIGGVKPIDPGFDKTLIAPHPGDLTFLRQTVPTPHGIIEVSWENKPNEKFKIKVIAPKKIELVFKLPQEGEIMVIKK